MSPAAVAEVQARQQAAEAMKNKVRAVESLERALWRWRSERKIDGADDTLLAAVEAFGQAFGGTK